MSAQTSEAKPALAALVMAGEGQTEATKINDFIWMVKDISNAYLINTADGDVLVNAGFMDNAERNKKLLAPHRKGPLRKIIITQAHADHYGGVPALREKDTQIVGERRFNDTWKYFDDLGPYLERRSRRLWASTVKRGADAPKPPKVAPDIEVDRTYAFEQGGKRFELISTPGGETLCSLTVWMPDDRIAFTGNLFGPVFEAMPNLTTTRGDKPRLVERYLHSLDRVRDLKPDLLITGHGEPIRGEATIRKSLDKMHGAVTFIRDAVIAGMNEGKDVHTLMREIVLPPELKIGEFHGNTRWAVRAIWEENSGWFHYDSTASLYGVPRSSINADLAELVGGAGPLAARARKRLSEGKALEAVHLLDIALDVEPNHAEALKVMKDALQDLLTKSGGSNLSETMWLRTEIARVDSLLAPG
jgi:alkyl sulfatase BDS1-like metallo-beta-lactamase superfamily hydrolase